MYKKSLIFTTEISPPPEVSEEVEAEEKLWSTFNLFSLVLVVFVGFWWEEEEEDVEEEEDSVYLISKDCSFLLPPPPKKTTKRVFF